MRFLSLAWFGYQPTTGGGQFHNGKYGAYSFLLKTESVGGLQPTAYILNLLFLGFTY